METRELVRVPSSLVEIDRNMASEEISLRELDATKAVLAVKWMDSASV
jgi:hypothetical protein